MIDIETEQQTNGVSLENNNAFFKRSEPCVVAPPSPVYTIQVSGIVVSRTGAKPNKWHRLWLKLILGIKIEDVK